MELSQNTKAEKVYLRALKNICKMLRDNPMGEINLYPVELLSVLCGGAKRDPDGMEYLKYFLVNAIEEIRKEETNQNE